MLGVPRCDPSFHPRNPWKKSLLLLKDVETSSRILCDISCYVKSPRKPKNYGFPYSCMKKDENKGNKHNKKRRFWKNHAVLLI
jgi:hypothetical protein